MTCLSKALMPLGMRKVHRGMRIAVAVRVFHAKKYSYIPTGVDVGCTVSRKGEIVPNWHSGMITTAEPEWLAKNQAVDDYMRFLEERYAHIVSPGSLTCHELCEQLREGGPAITERLTMKMATADYLEAKRGTVSKSYRQMVEHSISRFCEWVPGELYVAEITGQMLAAYQKYLKKLTHIVEKKESYYSVQYKQVRYRKNRVMERVLSDASVTKELAHIKAVINHVADSGAVSFKIHPFAEVTLPRSQAKETDVEPEVIRKLRDANLENDNHRLARDVFMLSFYLGGMNYKDILSADFSDDILVYCREKTKAATKVRKSIKVPILPEAREILDRRTKRGKWHSGYDYTDSRNEIGYIGKRLKDVVRLLGLPGYMTFYSARKSFAQYSLDLGINDAVTDYLMGHSDNKRGVISYYSRVTPRMAGVALRRVIDYMDHPEAFSVELEKAIMVQ